MENQAQATHPTPSWWDRPATRDVLEATEMRVLIIAGAMAQTREKMIYSSWEHARPTNLEIESAKQLAIELDTGWWLRDDDQPTSAA